MLAKGITVTPSGSRRQSSRSIELSQFRNVFTPSRFRPLTLKRMVSRPNPLTTKVRDEKRVALHGSSVQPLGETPGWRISLYPLVFRSISPIFTISSPLSSAIQIFWLGESFVTSVNRSCRYSEMAVDVAPLSTVPRSPDATMHPSSLPGRRCSA